MRVAMLSTTAAFSRITGTRGISTARLLHSSAKMRSVNPRQQIPAEWLRRIVDDDSAKPPPKLYAWTPKNLSVGGIGAGTEAHTKSGISDRREDDVNDNRRRIYILGIGNIGRLYAICLSKLASRPPITLVVHRKELLEHWAAEPGIELIRHGQAHRSADFDVEWWTDVAPSSGEGHVAEVAAGRKIGNIIVATKASDAMPQVDRVRRYLGSDSTVTFAQNGMCKLWPPLGDAYVRARFPDGTGPNWIACVTTHGVTSQGVPFKSVHAAPANALVGPVMPSSSNAGEEQMGYLVRQIADAPDLDARQVSRKELWVAQLEKLVVNAVINPLTAVLRCKNGELLVVRDGDALPDVIDKLLSEASKTLSALILDSNSDEILLSEESASQEGPKTSSSSSSSSSAAITAENNSSAVAAESLLLQAGRKQLLERFAFPRLRAMVLDVGVKVAANTSSMLQDVRAGKQTEVDDFNGWLVDTARLLDNKDKGHLRLPTHEKLIALVKARAELTRGELCARLLGEDNQS
ncbi:6-phosphogluconate dehydrogenase C-terminal domain-like protein [Xylariaceae sp. AK1471]|nr:6-phosphogluconate dehydrogenase C-terminal domain-like protein [Xylariaceae sp. AK1471]